MKKGIDVSVHNGALDWLKLRSKIDFAIIRAGFGKNNIDKRAHENAKACDKYGIDYGFYWFSYAYTVDMAIREANYCADFCDNYKPTYPIYFDFEYDSRNYANKFVNKITNSTIDAMAKAFCDTLEKRGYYAGIYANKDYADSVFKESTLNRYDLWYAQWSNKSSRSARMWQYTDCGTFTGISGKFDTNYCTYDYPTVIKTCGLNNHPKETASVSVKNRNNYVAASEVIAGKWGNGEERRARLEAAGYSYKEVQKIVNDMLR